MNIQKNPYYCDFQTETSEAEQELLRLQSTLSERASESSQNRTKRQANYQQQQQQQQNRDPNYHNTPSQPVFQGPTDYNNNNPSAHVFHQQQDVCSGM